jgi:peptidoglycan/xylan/chitin deacetylase (PgdA/CDA1 family)
MLCCLLGLGLLGTMYFKPKLLFGCFSSYCDVPILTTVKDKKYVVLTIDDVPRENIKRILNVLKKHEVTATFFVVSEQINDENTELLIQAVNEGHHLANHGKTNSCHALHSKIKLEEELSHCRQEIRNIYQLAEKPLPISQYYRPGSGFPSKEIKNYLDETGMRLVLGSVYPHDPQIKIKKLNQWYLNINTKGGDIIILHDLPDTPEILEKWIKKIKYNDGLNIVSLDQYDRLEMI